MSSSRASRRLGKYELLERIAVGGMGEVFLAVERGHAGVSRLVVIKLLLPELAEDPHEVALFIDEARISAQLSHPNIVSVLDFGKVDGELYLAMEHVGGDNLARLGSRAARSGVGLRRELAVFIVAEVARALDYAHSARDPSGAPLAVVHRDISPHNILVSRDGDVKLLDFGIATASSRQQRTRTGVVRGKLSYMSPEQLANVEVDRRSDVFSLGTVLWEMTLMRRLFAGDGELDTVRLLEECRVPAPRSIDPDYPADLEAVVMSALARNPEERFQNAGALEAALRTRLALMPPLSRRDLGAWVEDLAPEPAAVAEGRRRTMPPGGAPVRTRAIERPAPEPAPAPVGRRRWPALLMIAAALVAVAAVVAAVSMSRSGEAGPLALVAPPVDAGTAAVDDAAPVAIEIADAAPPEIAADAAPRARPDRRAPPRRVEADASVDTPAPVDAAPPAPPRPGSLGVRAEPYGRVTIDGAAAGATPVLQSLPPGRYRVSIAMSDGSGTFTATARVESGRKTKCNVVQRALVCR